MLKNLLDACGAGLAFYAVGYGLAFGDGTTSDGSVSFVGRSHFFLAGDTTVDGAFCFYEYAFSATAATIVAGTLSERCKMASYFAYSLVLTGLVYPVVAHCICTYIVPMGRISQ
jgi:ammonium transporter, Amt family